MDERFIYWINYGSEGWKPSDVYLDIDDCVKAAQDNSFGSEFVITKLINWVARESK